MSPTCLASLSLEMTQPTSQSSLTNLPLSPEANDDESDAGKDLISCPELTAVSFARTDCRQFWTTGSTQTED